MVPDATDPVAEWESPAVHDQAVGHVYHSDDTELPALGSDLGGFGQWSAVASTVYGKLYDIAAFDPGRTDFSAEAFEKMRHSFVTSPYWSAQLTTVVLDAHIRRDDYKEGVDAVLGFYRGAVALDVGLLVVNNVKQVAQLASKSPIRMRQKHSMFQNGALALVGGILHVAMVHAVVAMAMDGEKDRYVANDQSIKIQAYHGILNFDFCKRHPSNILSYTRKSVDAWKDMAAANHEPESNGDGWPRDG